MSNPKPSRSIDVQAHDYYVPIIGFFMGGIVAAFFDGPHNKTGIFSIVIGFIVSVWLLRGNWLSKFIDGKYRNIQLMGGLTPDLIDQTTLTGTPVLIAFIWGGIIRLLLGRESFQGIAIIVISLILITTVIYLIYAYTPRKK